VSGRPAEDGAADDPSDGRGRTSPPPAPLSPEETAARWYGADRRLRGVPGASDLPRGSWHRRVTDLARGVKDPLRVALVGLMGSGKSTVGALVARALGASFVDLDAEIEAATGRTVAQLFQDPGEAVFRALEVRALHDVLDTTRRAVIALGGGAVLSRAVRERLARDEGFTTVWLSAPPAALVARLGEGDAVAARPLLAGRDAAGREGVLARLLEERRPLYEEVARLLVEAGSRPPGAVAEEVVRRVRARCVERVSLPAESDMERHSARSYDVVVEAGALDRLGQRVRHAGIAARRVALVADAAVGKLYGARAGAALRAAGFDVARIDVPEGEAAKTVAALEVLYGGLSEARIDRSSAIVALGGGAATDAAGFAAATWLRGIDWVAVPTTLLGMVDAAVGGKTGIDLGARKNVVGAFWQPRRVVADPEVLATLPRREVLSGLGEVWKYALLEGGALLRLLEERLAPLAAAKDPGRALARAPEDAVETIARCVAAKARVVEEDERETLGRRQVLNLGHTLGHALESAARLALPHGACVAYGLRATLHLSVEKGLMSEEEGRRLRALLDLLPLPPIPKAAGDAAILEALRGDKKFKEGRMLFVLLEGAGRPRVDVEVGEGEIAGAIAAMRGKGGGVGSGVQVQGEGEGRGQVQGRGGKGKRGRGKGKSGRGR
jgi:3-dehydroquinate synthase